MNDFLSSMKSNGAEMVAAASMRDVAIATGGLQAIRAAILPAFMIELYGQTNGIILGNAYIFGATENKFPGRFPVPGIGQINAELAALDNMRGMTVFGRNDLFWFAFDAFGVCRMLDNTGLHTLRKYDDPYRAMTDCMAVGKM